MEKKDNKINKFVNLSKKIEKKKINIIIISELKRKTFNSILIINFFSYLKVFSKLEAWTKKLFKSTFFFCDDNDSFLRCRKVEIVEKKIILKPRKKTNDFSIFSRNFFLAKTRIYRSRNFQSIKKSQNWIRKQTNNFIIPKKILSIKSVTSVYCHLWIINVHQASKRKGKKRSFQLIIIIIFYLQNSVAIVVVVVNLMKKNETRQNSFFPNQNNKI